jgi:PAS domain S-box-containing protein
VPHEKGQGAAFSFDNLNHSWLGAVELATFMLERVISQLRGLVGFALGTRNLHMPIVLSVLVLAGYYAGGIVGIQLGLPPSGIGATWPPTAILLAALLLAPPRYWWMYLLGVVPAHLHVVASFQLPEVPFVVMLCQVGSNILLAVLAALALRPLIGAPPQLGNHRNMGAFILLGVLATAVASAVAVWLFLLTGWAADFWPVWRQRVLANVFSIITIPPVIVLAFAGQLVGAHATRRAYLELALITVGVLVVGIPVFGLDSPGPSTLPALLFAPLPFLIWAAVRVGVGGTGLTLLIVAGIALANAYIGRGPFINQAPDVNVLSLQIFLPAISIPILLLAALVEERRQAEESLKQISKRAEVALAERSLQLALAGKAALVGSYAYDVDTDMMQVDAGYAALHGLPEGTVQTTRSEWRAKAHPDDAARVEGMRQQAFREGLGEYAIEYRIVRSGGEVRWIESRSFITYTSEGRPQRVAGVNIDITGRKRAEEARTILNAELDHRVKNALATVSAVVSHTREGRRSVDDFIAAIEGRLRSMATTHELLSSRRWQGLPLTELVRRELAPYVTRNNTEINGPGILLKAEAGQALAMVLHELATNAAKYGALSTKEGRVSVRWDRHLNADPCSHLVLEWQEIGGPPVVAPGESSYGMSTIRDLIPYEFAGTVDLVLAPEGVRCRLELPADCLSNDREPVSETTAHGITANR